MLDLTRWGGEVDADDGRLETVDALQFANVSRSDWNNAINRGLYPNAPPTDGPRQVRLFDVNDLVAAHVLGQLFERRVMASFACPIAVDVLKAMRKSPELETLSAWKCFKRNGSPYVVVSVSAPQPGVKELFKFDVGEIRREAIAGIRRKLAGDA